MRRLLATILLTSGLSVQAVQGAEIFCNAKGLECSDRPTAGANIARSAGSLAETRRSTPTQGSSAAGGTTGANASAGAPDSGIKADPVAEQQRQNAALAAANKAMQKDLADKRSEQCRKAQDYYKQAIAATAIYRTDKDGKKQLLSEAEANQSRLAARLEIERTCGKSGN